MREASSVELYEINTLIYSDGVGIGIVDWDQNTTGEARSIHAKVLGPQWLELQVKWDEDLLEEATYCGKFSVVWK